MAPRLAEWAGLQHLDESDDRAACKDWVARLGQAGWLRYCVPAAHGGALPALDSRSLVILRETLAFHSSLADFSFAMQGLGSGAITLAGTPAQQATYLSAVGPRPEDRGLRAQRARGRLRRGRDGHARHADRAGLDARGQQDLDQQRVTWRTFMSSSPRPTRTPARAASAPSSSTRNSPACTAANTST